MSNHDNNEIEMLTDEEGYDLFVHLTDSELEKMRPNVITLLKKKKISWESKKHTLDSQRKLERMDEKLDLILKKLDIAVPNPIKKESEDSHLDEITDRKVQLELEIALEDNKKLITNGNKLKEKFSLYAKDHTHLHDFIDSIEFKPSTFGVLPKNSGSHKLKSVLEDNKKLITNGNELKQKFLMYLEAEGSTVLTTFINSIEFKLSDDKI